MAGEGSHGGRRGRNRSHARPGPPGRTMRRKATCNHMGARARIKANTTSNGQPASNFTIGIEEHGDPKKNGGSLPSEERAGSGYGRNRGGRAGDSSRPEALGDDGKERAGGAGMSYRRRRLAAPAGDVGDCPRRTSAVWVLVCFGGDSAEGGKRGLVLRTPGRGWVGEASRRSG